MPPAPPALPSLPQRLAPRERPTTAPVMFQRWTDVLFLHWAWDAAAIQATLPPGLHVDTHQGQAWLGVVPFWMDAVRPRFLPPVPGLSWFLELNLRTYVYDANGQPGVWFYSLDCNQPIAVALARTLFNLNYVHARQAGRRSGPDHPAEFHSVRRATGGQSHFTYRAAGAATPAAPDSLEFFLAERYVLFAERRGQLLGGRVWHQPYQLSPVKIDQAETALFTDQGFAPPSRPADHAMLSAGVPIEVHPLARIR